MTASELQILCNSLHGTSRISDHPRMVRVTFSSKKKMDKFIGYAINQMMDSVSVFSGRLD
jgi:hypothetical protein